MAYAYWGALGYLVLGGAWFLYLLAGYDLSHRDRPVVLALALGFVVLLLPPLYVFSYDSVSNVTSELVGITRTFPTGTNDSATIHMVFKVYSKTGFLPISIDDFSYSLDVNLTKAGQGFLKGGTIYPLGHLQYDITVNVRGSIAQSIRTDITQLDLWYYGDGVVSSILYRSDVYSVIGFHAYWNWLRNATCDGRYKLVPGIAC